VRHSFLGFFFALYSIHVIVSTAGCKSRFVLSNSIEEAGPVPHHMWNSPWLSPYGPLIRHSPRPMMSVAPAIKWARQWHSLHQVFAKDPFTPLARNTRNLRSCGPRITREQERHLTLQLPKRSRRSVCQSYSPRKADVRNTGAGIDNSHSPTNTHPIIKWRGNTERRL